MNEHIGGQPTIAVSLMDLSAEGQVLNLAAGLEDGRVGEGIGLDAFSHHFLVGFEGILREVGLRVGGNESVPRVDVERVSDGPVGFDEEAGGGVEGDQAREEGGVKREAEREDEGVELLGLREGFEGDGGGEEGRDGVYEEGRGRGETTEEREGGEGGGELGIAGGVFDGIYERVEGGTGWRPLHCMEEKKWGS